MCLHESCMRVARKGAPMQSRIGSRTVGSSRAPARTPRDTQTAALASLFCISGGRAFLLPPPAAPAHHSCGSAGARICQPPQAGGGGLSGGPRLGARMQPPREDALAGAWVRGGLGRGRRAAAATRTQASLSHVASATTAIIFPGESLKGAITPIILVIFLCLLAAIPLGPSLTQTPPELVGEPGSATYERASRIKKVLGLQRRVFTSVMLGALVSAWIFSGTLGFTLVLCLCGSRALREYYDMAEAAQPEQCKPARKCGTAALCLMYLTACGAAYGLPLAYSDAVLPVAYLLIVTYLLTLKRNAQMTIAAVQTTFMGMFYIGYLSSFWVRMRGIGAIPTGDMLKVMSTGVPFIDATLGSWATYISPDVFTQGAVVTWWTMISIAASDVGAYFTGKNLGKTRLADVTGISVSPNKTMEGFLGGIVLCSVFATTGARLMGWPMWWVFGPIYGVMISTLGLLGDLTVSLFKRDAGVKDTGNLLPGHGGILDRVDSYMLTAAPVYFFVQFISRLQGFS